MFVYITLPINFQLSKKVISFQKICIFVHNNIRISNKFRLLHIFSPKETIVTECKYTNDIFHQEPLKTSGAKMSIISSDGFGVFPSGFEGFCQWDRIAKVGFESGLVYKNSGFWVCTRSHPLSLIQHSFLRNMLFFSGVIVCNCSK